MNQPLKTECFTKCWCFYPNHSSDFPGSAPHNAVFPGNVKDSEGGVLKSHRLHVVTNCWYGLHAWLSVDVVMGGSR